MPKKTFFNLKDEKKQRIIDAAMEEFAFYPYLKTSIDRIIERANISKGSFYQYFDNKKDLYKYLIVIITEKKINFLNQKLENYSNYDFFSLLRELFIAGIQFKNKYPLISKIGDRHLIDENDPLKNEVHIESKSKSNYFFEELLNKAVKEGQIDQEIDIKFISFMLTDFTISITNYFFKNHDPDKLDEIMDYVDKMLYIMKCGMEKSKNSNN